MDDGDRVRAASHKDATARRVAWRLLAAVALVNASRYALRMWNLPLWVDEVAHGATVGAVTFAVTVDAMGSMIHGARWHPARSIGMATLTGLGIAALWEMAEWGLRAHHGGWETVMHLTSAAAGALLAAMGATLLARPSPSVPRAR